ncbi:hypothetical protein [Acinetobacter radioresistens]|uniref:hypothetical protein n=1 Tax=Acinetobacter radioresistens TaxID=40216 RepID=UPI0032660ECC
MIKKVYRDKDGNVINIGEWDYIITCDEDNNEVINNPLPAGATFQDEEIVILDDGGLAAAE